MNVQKQNELYRGKAKTVYETDQADYLILNFRDDTSAFDGQKIEQLDDKGHTNNKFNAFIMEKLAEANIPTHFEKVLNDTDSLVKRLNMIPVECVVRNIAAGSICRRLGVQEGTELTTPIFEFFLKNDELHDPMINEYHIKAFNWATEEQVVEMQKLTFACNTILKDIFAKAGIILVDYKLEFGVFSDGKLYLGDEFTPDGCRLWDATTKERLDKDRFRRDLGGVVEAYHAVGDRLGIQF